jgi:dihydrodipicolinate synthase/N-acetylneuraminate lyase
MNQVTSERQRLQVELFPHGIPRLWCPTLSHFQAARQPDAARIMAHLHSLSARVHGILVPGSTGEGWEMNDADICGLLGIVLAAASELNMRVLVGILKTTIDEMLDSIQAMADILKHPAVVGITVCPPRGASLSQQEIREGLGSVLRLGWPTALYQLPQVTQNEMNDQTVATLAADFHNFIMFKDTSGSDQVALSGIDLGGVFMLRGAEQGGYARWPRAGGGPYDGFLLSTSNVFAKQLDEILQALDMGKMAIAQTLSANLVEVVSQAFDIVRDFPAGNPFANANKLIDHCLAYGNLALRVPPPILYSGQGLPDDFVVSAVSLLETHTLLPATGYLAKADAV